MPTEAVNYDKALENLVKKFPKHFEVKSKKNLYGLLKALATGDAYIETIVEAVSDSLYSVTAKGRHLASIGAKYGVVQDLNTGIGDEDFRRIIPAAGTSAKQVLSTLQELLDAAYGPYLTTANLRAETAEPYRITTGADLRLKVDANTLIVVEFATTDATSLSAATAQELATAITTKTDGRVIGSVVKDQLTNKKYLNIRTKASGPQGFLQVVGGDTQSSLRFGVMRETTQGIGTWAVTQYGTADEMLWTLSSGTDPNILGAGVAVGDLVTIRAESGFHSRNCGTFAITAVGNGYFRLRNPQGKAETVTQSNSDDLTFYRADAANVLTAARKAAIVQPAPNLIKVLLPVTSPIVRRNTRTAAYRTGACAQVSGVSSNTITLPSADAFKSSGAVRPLYTRSYAKSAIESVTSTTITLASASGFPTAGAIFSPVNNSYYYFNGISGQTLQNVTPTPDSAIVGSYAQYCERYKYTSKSSTQLLGVFPNPTNLLGQDIVQSAGVLPDGQHSSYLYDASAKFTATRDLAKLETTIRRGEYPTAVSVDDVSSWPESGFVVFEPGTDSQEGPIKYLAKINNQTLLLSPTEPLQISHLPLTRIRRVTLGGYRPKGDGSDHPVYLTSGGPTRELIEKFIESLTKSGAVVQFIIATPDYKWPLPTEIFASSPSADSL